MKTTTPLARNHIENCLKKRRLHNGVGIFISFLQNSNKNQTLFVPKEKENSRWSKEYTVITKKLIQPSGGQRSTDPTGKVKTRAKKA